MTLDISPHLFANVKSFLGFLAAQIAEQAGEELGALCVLVDFTRCDARSRMMSFWKAGMRKLAA